MNESHIRNVVEAALLAAGKPLQLSELVELFDEGARPQAQDVHAALQSLMAEYSNRGIEIKETATGFRIQVRREMANEISRLWPERPARYSRALLETLALIAYRQPITRAEIEAVRGVAVNPNILKTLIERNWVRVVGHRDVPGRPELLGTTRDFLDYFGLKSLDELPPLAELKTIGDIKVQFDLPDPGPLAASAGESAEAAAPAPVGDEAAAVASAAAASEFSSSEGAASGADGAHAGQPGAVSSEAAAANEATEPEAIPLDAVASDATGPDSAGPRAAVADAGTAASEAEEFAARINAELESADDDGADDEELSAAAPGSGELVAGPPGLDD